MPIDLNARWHNVPMWGWYLGLTVAGTGTIILVRRYRAAHQPAGAAQLQTGDLASYPPDNGVPGPGGGPGANDNTSTMFDRLGTILGKQFDTLTELFSRQQEANTKLFHDWNTSQQTQEANWFDQLSNQLRSQQSSAAPPATTASAGTPVNQFHIGQSVSPTEKIVASIFSPVFGWLNQTNLGGIYTGGGGNRGIASEPHHGSYLGYVSDTFSDPAQVQAEIGQHGNFTGDNSLVLLPNGGYGEVNNRGERYEFPI